MTHVALADQIRLRRHRVQSCWKVLSKIYLVLCLGTLIHYHFKLFVSVNSSPNRRSSFVSISFVFEEERSTWILGWIATYGVMPRKRVDGRSRCTASRGFLPKGKVAFDPHYLCVNCRGGKCSFWGKSCDCCCNRLESKWKGLAVYTKNHDPVLGLGLTVAMARLRLVERSRQICRAFSQKLG